MAEQLVPILRVADARRAAEWYGQLGFEVEFEEQYSPEFPAYVGMAKGDLALHLSERAGDATPDTLLVLYVDDVDKLAADLGVEVVGEGRNRELHLTDVDRNRIRVGTRSRSDSDNGAAEPVIAGAPGDDAATPRQPGTSPGTDSDIGSTAGAGSGSGSLTGAD